MSKPFFEVFPTLKVNEDIRMLFEGVEVIFFASTFSAAI